MLSPTITTWSNSHWRSETICAFMDGVATVPGMQLSDGMHPTPKGVKVIVSKILPVVEQELKRLK